MDGNTVDGDRAGGGIGDDLNQLKNMDRVSFFSFDRLYFPVVAKWLFMFLCAVIVVSGIVGILGSFTAVFTSGALVGLGGIVASVAWVVLAVFFLRICFEFILVLFSINDAVQDIRNSRGR